jgi:gamma-glutamyltranspeptidase/glutathione hydrolase
MTVTEAAGKAVEAGGGVVDAAIVAALTAMCTEPGICAPAGGGFLTISIPGSNPVVVDGYMSYPGLGFEGKASSHSVTMTYGGGVTTLVGAGSIAVPGVFAGLAIASKEFGRIPWRELMEVVADTVEHGFPLGEAAWSYLTHAGEPIFSDDPVVKEALFDDGRLRQAGELITVPGLAGSLRHIGEEGARTFYEGDLAREMVTDIEARGGRLTMADLASYRAEIREPLEVDMDGWSFWLNPPPAVGGATVAVALGELARSQDPGPGSWPRALITAFTARREELELAPDPNHAVARALARAGLRSPSTISVSTSDSEGGAVAGTFSAGYGSGVIPGTTGLMMNNALGEVELMPVAVDDLEPGGRMMSNMAPTVGRNGEDVVAIGSPGADRITTAIFSTLASLVDGFGLADAIDHPRAHPEFTDDGLRIAVEPGLDLGGMDAPVRGFDGLDMYFGGVNGTAIQRGRLTAHADVRRSGAVAIFG